MKRVSIFIVLFAMLGMFSASAQQPTIHAIAFCNTLDESIGKSCEFDYNLFLEEVNEISNVIDFDVKYYTFIGEKCSNDNIKDVLTKLRCNEKDVIIFYYTGHGTRARNDVSKFPQMCLKYDMYQEKLFYPVKDVIKTLSQKPAHFKLILTDCCNNVLNGVSVKSLATKSVKSNQTIDPKVYKKLFCDYNGMIACTSSKVGQTSVCSSEPDLSGIGGYFSYSFWYMLFAAGTNNIAPNWNTILAYTRNAVMAYQEPYWETYNGNAGTNNNSDNNTIVEDNTSLSSMLTALVRNDNVHSKLLQATGILSKFFTADAKVLTVEGSTSTDYESAEEFLKRICYSKIKGFKFLDEKKSNGKVSFLKVQEIR